MTLTLITILTLTGAYDLLCVNHAVLPTGNNGTNIPGTTIEHLKQRRKPITLHIQTGGVQRRSFAVGKRSEQTVKELKR